MTTGTVACLARSCRTTSKPFIFGNMTSKITRSVPPAAASVSPFFAVRRDLHVVALGLEIHAQAERDALVVFDDQDALFSVLWGHCYACRSHL